MILAPIGLWFSIANATFTPSQLWRPPWGQDVQQVALHPDGRVASVHCDGDTCHLEVRPDIDQTPVRFEEGPFEGLAAIEDGFLATTRDGRWLRIATDGLSESKGPPWTQLHAEDGGVAGCRDGVLWLRPTTGKTLSVQKSCDASWTIEPGGMALLVVEGDYIWRYDASGHAPTDDEAYAIDSDGGALWVSVGNGLFKKKDQNFVSVPGDYRNTRFQVSRGRPLEYFEDLITVEFTSVRPAAVGPIAWNGEHAAWVSEHGLEIWRPSVGGTVGIRRSTFGGPLRFEDTSSDQAVLRTLTARPNRWSFQSGTMTEFEGHRALVPGGGVLSSDKHLVFSEDGEERWRVEGARGEIFAGSTVAFVYGARVQAVRMHDGVVIDEAKLKSGHTTVSGDTLISARMGGASVWTPGRQPEEVYDAYPLTTGHFVVTRDDTFEISDANGRLVQSVPARPGSVVAVDRRRRAYLTRVGPEVGWLERWLKGEKVEQHPMPGPIKKVTASPNGDWIAGVWEGMLYRLRPDAPAQLLLKTSPYPDLHWVSSDTLLIVEPGRIRHFDIRGGVQWEVGIDSQITDSSLAGSTLWTVHENTQLLQWNLEGEVVHALWPGPVRGASFTADSVTVERAWAPPLTIHLDGAPPLDGPAVVAPLANPVQVLERSKGVSNILRVPFSRQESAKPLAVQGSRALLLDAPDRLRIVDLRSGRWTHQIYLVEHDYGVLTADGQMISPAQRPAIRHVQRRSLMDYQRQERSTGDEREGR